MGVGVGVALALALALALAFCIGIGVGIGIVLDFGIPFHQNTPRNFSQPLGVWLEQQYDKAAPFLVRRSTTCLASA